MRIVFRPAVTRCCSPRWWAACCAVSLTRWRWFASHFKGPVSWELCSGRRWPGAALLLDEQPSALSLWPAAADSPVTLKGQSYENYVQAGGDQVLLSSVMSSLLRCLSDPLPLIRQMAVEGLAGLVHCSPLEIETLAEVGTTHDSAIVTK